MSHEAEICRKVVSGDRTVQPGMLRRLLTERAYRVRLLRHALGLPTPLDSPDRQLLERTILPWFAAQPDTRRVLFVGCDWYTRHYGAYFRDQEYWTVDPAESARRFGSRHHLTLALEALTPGEAGLFDLIVVNGVYGFGLDSHEQCERAFAACHACLEPGGWLILGWDDVPARTPVPLESIASLRRFERSVFLPLGSHRVLTPTAWRHTYDFFRRRAQRGA